MYDGKLIEAMDEFDAFVNYGNYNSASFNLALVIYCLPNVSSNVRRQIQKRIQSAEVSLELIDGGIQELNKRIRRVDQIISVGSSWNIDEVFLLIQLRIEIDVLTSFLTNNAKIAPPNLSDIDIWFDGVSISTEHRAYFERAARMIAKNWKVPIVTKWLEPK